MLFRLVIFMSLTASSFISATPIIIGIAGGTGSGKTTLAKKLQTNFSLCSTLVSQDAYYKDLSHLPLDKRSLLNFDHPNAIDFDLLINHIKSLKDGKTIKQPVYDFSLHCRTAKIEKVKPADLIILEGILVLAVKELRELCDIKVFIDADHDVRMLRRIERDIKERGRTLSQIKHQYLTSVKPMHNAFVEPSKIHADVIIPGGGNNSIALALISAKLGHDLQLDLKTIESMQKR